MTGGSSGREFACLTSAPSPRSRTSASSSCLIASSTILSRCSHCSSTSTMLSSVSTSGGSSSLTPSRRSARCWMPALTATSTFVSRSNLTRCRSDFRSSGEPAPSSANVSSVPAANLRRCTRSWTRVFFSWSCSIFCCDSLVIASRFLCVSSCVMNFWMTSLTSATPVASLISRKAASYAAIFSCSSSMSASVMLCCELAPRPASGALGVAIASRRAFSRRSSSELISCFLTTRVLRSLSSFSRSLRSSDTSASNLESSCLAISLAWLASCDISSSSS
mmetsp:Transcript_24311/g.62103  ORF Transcript_24311/g.62103 Transcript_24311/m.62103 type:complete len:278 (+) Transcript_24311:444-1277(+)